MLTADSHVKPEFQVHCNPSLSISSNYQQLNVTKLQDELEASALITFDVCCLHSYRDFSVHGISLHNTHAKRFRSHIIEANQIALRWDRFSYVSGA